MANISAIRQQAAPTTYQLASQQEPYKLRAAPITECIAPHRKINSKRYSCIFRFRFLPSTLTLPGTEPIRYAPEYLFASDIKEKRAPEFALLLFCLYMMCSSKQNTTNKRRL